MPVVTLLPRPQHSKCTPQLRAGWGLERSLLRLHLMQVHSAAGSACPPHGAGIESPAAHCIAGPRMSRPTHHLPHMPYHPSPAGTRTPPTPARPLLAPWRWCLKGEGQCAYLCRRFAMRGVGLLVSKDTTHCSMLVRLTRLSAAWTAPPAPGPPCLTVRGAPSLGIAPRVTNSISTSQQCLVAGRVDVGGFCA